MAHDTKEFTANSITNTGRADPALGYSPGRQRFFPIGGRIPIFLTVLILALIALAPYLAPFDPNSQTLLSRLRPPLGFDKAISGHILGTDELGRDILSRTLTGLRLTMAVAAAGSFVSICIGVFCGTIAGYSRGLVSRLVDTLIDVQTAVPSIVISLVAVAIFGSSFPVLIIVMGVSGWEACARVVRAQVLMISGELYVISARAAGASHSRVIFCHILPNAISSIVVVWSLNFAGMIALESSLSFLGLGIPPPTATLGSMVGAGRSYLATAPWLAIVPSVCIVLIVLFAGALGESIRIASDVKRRRF